LAHILVLTVVFPSIIQFTHIFENHEHTFCGNVDTHIHEQKLDCDLTKFISSVFYINYEDLKVEEVLDTSNKLNNYYSFTPSKRLSQSNYLRGPPFI
jgi:hypothetical protein